MHLGLVLKVASLLAKLYFLLYWVSFWEEGAYSRYFVYFSVSLVVGRVLSLSAEDLIPLFCKGDLTLSYYYQRIYLAFITFNLLVMIFVSFVESWMGLAIFMGGVFASGYIASGITRIVDNIYYEIILNFPWVVLIVWSFYSRSQLLNAYDALEALALWTFFVQLFVFLVFSRRYLNRDFSKMGRMKIGLIGVAAKKLMLNLKMLLKSRGVVLFPFIFQINKLSDSLALVITISESIWQLVMVYINNRYTRQCKDGYGLVLFDKDNFLLILGLVSASTITFVGAPLMSEILAFFRHQVEVEHIYMSGLIVYSMTVFFVVRNFLWINELQDRILYFYLAILIFLIVALVWVDLIFYYYPIEMLLSIFLYIYARNIYVSGKG